MHDILSFKKQSVDQTKKKIIIINKDYFHHLLVCLLFFFINGLLIVRKHGKNHKHSELKVIYFNVVM